MKIHLKRVLSSIFLLLSAASAATAMTVSPMQVEMISAGARSRAQVSVVNNSDRPMPVEAVLQRLTLDENGKQKVSKAGEDFLVMPPQAMIPPGATQNFRIQWLGDPMMAQSQSFILAINQVPVKLPDRQAGVQFVMGLGVMVNVAPAAGQSRTQGRLDRHRHGQVRQKISDHHRAEHLERPRAPSRRGDPAVVRFVVAKSSAEKHFRSHRDRSRAAGRQAKIYASRRVAAGCVERAGERADVAEAVSSRRVR